MKWILIALTFCSGMANAAGYTAKVKSQFWDVLYQDGGRTLYCAHQFQPHDHQDMQIEHVYTAAEMVAFLGCGSRKECRKTSMLFNEMEGDLYNLYPALIQTNQRRKAKPFGYVPGERWNYWWCDLEIRDGVIEPRELSRGAIARARLYMHKEYEAPLTNKALMLEWHMEYPITPEEERRNKVIKILRAPRE